MFLDYFINKERYLKELISEVKTEIADLNTKIKENRRFMEYIEESKTTPFTEFTPQIISNTEKRKQHDIDELDKNLKTLKIDKERRLSLLEEELADTLKYMREAKEYITEIKSVSEERCNETRGKLLAVKEIVIQDPFRAKLEIDEIIESL